jgi:hypothetical protein
LPKPEIPKPLIIKNEDWGKWMRTLFQKRKEHGAAKIRLIQSVHTTTQAIVAQEEKLTDLFHELDTQGHLYDDATFLAKMLELSAIQRGLHHLQAGIEQLRRQEDLEQQTINTLRKLILENQPPRPLEVVDTENEPTS